MPLEKLPPSQIVQKKLDLAEAEETSEEDGMTIAELLRSRKRRNAVGSGQLGDGESLGNLQFFSSLMADKEVTKFIDLLTASIENVTLNATVETGLETAKKDADATETGSRSHDMERFQGCERDGDQYAAEMQELRLEDRISASEVFVHFLLSILDYPNIEIPSKKKPDGSDNEIFLDFEQQDQILLCWLSSSISQDLLPQLVGCSTTCEAWHSVERLFASQSRANVMQLKLQLQTLKKSGSIMTDYLIKKKIPITSMPGTFSMPEITALLLTHEARIEQHSQTEMLSVNLASNNQDNFLLKLLQDFCLILLDILSHYTTIMQSNVEAWTEEIRGRVVCDVCGDSSIGPEDHVLEGPSLSLSL
ncbi:hypothetical protein EZV62_009035 [Acer yangbiense]|uniref:Uncharacterized protein n=1 Tax=Acer yangbiense TaxID=1000413 RepID=A0A5C7IEK8_9ROSI|nr:hypothetical protein EZV62_009035 [Acer yangbiense]